MKLYALTEDLLPPLLFRNLKKTIFYRWAVKQTQFLTGSIEPEILTIQSGDLSGSKLKFSLSGEWQRDMINGIYDTELFEYLKKEKLEGKVIYDIGAHICYHSLMFSKYVGEKGQVYAFEPNPANAKRAGEILELNPDLKNRIELFNNALSDQSGVTSFLSTDNIEGGTSTGGFIDDASTIWERSIYINKTGFKASEVLTDTIDMLVGSGRILAPDILKIDVEGAEQLVLKGALKTLEEKHPLIIVEFHSIFSTYECLEIFKKFDYECSILKKESDGRVMIVAR